MQQYIHNVQAWLERVKPYVDAETVERLNVELERGDVVRIHEQVTNIYEQIQRKRVPIGGHTLPQLPYAYNALEPYIAEEIMRLHHEKHHQSYVDGLNRAEK